MQPSGCSEKLSRTQAAPKNCALIASQKGWECSLPAESTQEPSHAWKLSISPVLGVNDFLAC